MTWIIGAIVLIIAIGLAKRVVRFAFRLVVLGVLALLTGVLVGCGQIATAPVVEERTGVHVSVVEIGDGIGWDTLSFMARNYDGPEIAARIEDLLGFSAAGSTNNGTIAIAVAIWVADPPSLYFTATTPTDTARMVWP